MPTDPIDDELHLPLDPVEARVDEVLADRTTRAWMKRLKRLLKEMPDTVHLYASEDLLSVLARRADGRIFPGSFGMIDPRVRLEDHHSPQLIISEK